MCVCSTAKRRRRQAVGGYRHLPPMKRPHYSVRSAEKLQRRLLRLIATERKMREKKAKGF